MTSRPLSLRHTDSPSRRKQGFTLIEFLVVFAVLAVLVALFLPATRNSRGAARWTQCKSNLKQIALALQNYADAYGSLPPAHTVDDNGRPLHSWRTLILPYIDQKALYDQIDLSKPWDDPANSKAFKAKIPLYQCPEMDCPADHTKYLGIEGPQACFQGSRPRPISEITKSHDSIVMVIEMNSANAVHWMAPRDANESLVLGLEQKSKMAHSSGILAAYLDGGIRSLDFKTPAEERRALMSITEDAGSTPGAPDSKSAARNQESAR